MLSKKLKILRGLKNDLAFILRSPSVVVGQIQSANISKGDGFFAARRIDGVGKANFKFGLILTKGVIL
jgi:hypothetical protein